MSIILDESGHAVIKPLKSIQDVLDWKPSTLSWNMAAMNKAATKVEDSADKDHRVTKMSRPQVLMCHDMCGGYLEDRFVHGCSAASAYKFYHWQFIDIFVYFSHNFITIPPAGWMRAAHKHGVIVLGTIITEWDEGAEICKELLKSDELIDQFSTKLAHMALVKGFNGWLVNIENKIETEHISRLQAFVQQLTTKCHRLLDVSKVLWYDSVINTGELKWQDELNSLNELFFTASDGIFLNYGITEEKLTRSRQMSAICGREVDVFAGIDIFGRSSVASGGFNTIETLKMIQDKGLSCALFAPGWVYEQFGPEQFNSKEQMFWGILSEVLSPKPLEIPFATSFCQGYGDRFYVQGQVVTDSPWYNLSLQQKQPSFTHSQFVSYTVRKVQTCGDLTEEQPKPEKQTFEVETCESHPARPEMTFDLNCGYLGGGSLKLAAASVQSMPVLFRLFTLRATKDNPVCISVTWNLPPKADFHAGIVLSDCGAGKSSREPMVVCLDTALSDGHRSLVQTALANNVSTPVHFLTGVKNEVSAEGKWTKRNFEVNLNFLSKDKGQECLSKDDSQKCLSSDNGEDYILSVILIPSLDGVRSGTQMYIHIGHLQVFGASGLNQSVKDSKTGDLKHLAVEMNSHLSREVMENILIQPCFSSDKLLSRETADHEFPLQKTEYQKQINFHSEIPQQIDIHSEVPDPINQAEKRDLLSTGGSITDDGWKCTVNLISSPGADSQDLLHIFRWKALSTSVYVYLVFRHEENGLKECIGHTVENWFVWKQTRKANKVLKFSLQPIMKNGHQLEEIFVCV